MKNKEHLPNPAANKMTASESAVYKIIHKRQGKGETTTSGDVARDWDGKERSYVYRVLKGLTGKGLLERYNHRYYKTKSTN
jgi:predicted transcriptional regulator